MNAKKGLKIALGLILLATLVFIFFGIKGGKEAVDYKVETRADGEFMTMRFFNDNQKEALKFKCKKAYKESNDRTLMKQVEALIFKKGRMNKDIKVFGDEGYVDNNEHDFFVQNNARLVSRDFNIVSDSFKLKDRAELRSAPRVEYKTDTLTGLAAKGMEYYLNANTLKFYETSGTYKRNNRLFHYKTSVLWFIEKSQMMVLEKDSVIRDQTSLMKSDWISLKFSEDLKHIKETISQKNSYLYVEDPEKNEVKEVKAENIRNKYNKAGQMTQLTVVKDAEILLKDQFNRTMISASFVEMNFDGPTGKALNVLIPYRGKVENSGETKFKVVADSIKVDYDENGDIRYCEGTGGVRFIVDDYRGGTQKIGYDISNNSMTLQGGETEFVNGDGNTFKAPKFSVDTLNKVLTTNSGVKSVISLKKANVLFSADPIFINSKKFTIYEKEGRFNYEKDVHLNQGDIVLDAGKLEMNGDDHIDAKGNVSFSFKDKSGGSDIAMKGKEVIFDSPKRRININGNAVIKSNENILRASNLIIHFNDKNEVSRIEGEKDVNFLKDDLSGYSSKVNWLFKEETIILKGSPYIIKKGESGTTGGRTEGKELQIDLKTDKITILSGDQERTKTVIK
jgi:lipopolysaccharide transport protein LptA